MKKKRRLRLHMFSMFFIFLLVLSGSFSAFAKADNSSIEPEKLETQQKEEGAIFEDDPPEIQGDIENLDEGLEDGEEIFTEEVPQAEDIFQSEEEAEPLPEEEEPGKTPEGDMEIQEDPAPGSMSVFTDGAGETAGRYLPVSAVQGREPLLKKGFCKNPRFLQCGMLADIGRRIFDGRFVFMAYKKNS